MKQILHIFAKDTRRFWPEISISLAITAAFVSFCPNLWTDYGDPRSQMLKALAGLLVALVPVSWCILIARVIHAERLVGDTQYWITRPYTWKILLVAKLLFLAVFLYAPFFLAQYLLLAEAGFHPQFYIAGLLYSLLLVTGCLVLPLVALTTITSNFARLTITILGILVAAFGLTALSALFFNNGAGSIDNTFGARLSFALVVSACGAAALTQYAQRKLWLARTVLIALPILLCAVAFIAPDQALMNSYYPPASVQASTTQAGAPVQLAYNPEMPRGGTNIQSTGFNVQIGVNVPLMGSGVAEGTAVLLEDVRAEVTAPDGSHWASAWQPLGNKFLPGESSEIATFMMPVKEYLKFQTMPLSMHLTFAAVHAQAGQSITLPLPTGKFSVPDFGVCAPQMNSQAALAEVEAIHCISALRKPPLTYIHALWSDASCSASPAGSDSGELASTWEGSLNRAPAEFGFSSVTQEFFYLFSATDPGNTKKRHLCPGTPITFTQYNAVRRTQTSLSIEDFHLPKATIAGGKVSVEAEHAKEL